MRTDDKFDFCHKGGVKTATELMQGFDDLKASFSMQLIPTFWLSMGLQPLTPEMAGMLPHNGSGVNASSYANAHTSFVRRRRTIFFPTTVTHKSLDNTVDRSDANSVHWHFSAVLMINIDFDNIFSS